MTFSRELTSWISPTSKHFIFERGKGFQLRSWAQPAQFLQRDWHYDGLTQKYGTVFGILPLQLAPIPGDNLIFRSQFFPELGWLSSVEKVPHVSDNNFSILKPSYVAVLNRVRSLLCLKFSAEFLCKQNLIHSYISSNPIVSRTLTFRNRMPSRWCAAGVPPRVSPLACTAAPCALRSPRGAYGAAPGWRWVLVFSLWAVTNSYQKIEVPSFQQPLMCLHW